MNAPGLRFQFGRDGKSLTISDRNGVAHRIPCRLESIYAGEYRRAIKRSLDRLKACVGGEETPVREVHQALGELNRRGLSLVWQIFGDQRETVVELFRNAFPFWETAAKPFLVTISADLGRYFPLEFLPLFSLSEWPKPDDLETLEAAARRFPGFTAIVRREFLDIPVSQDFLIENRPKLALKCFTYRGLEGMESEIGFLLDQDWIDVDGPWPDRKLRSEEFSRSFAGHLRHADRRFNGQYREHADQIHHFVCHCEIDEEVTGDSRLRFSHGNEATIADLQASFAVMKDGGGETYGPLVFLNACESSTIDAMAVTSFPRFFLAENRNRGFIGTETNVPDAFAAEFARRFYQNLIGGSTLGEAIHRAKWQMLEEKNNPLGILYTVYADPELRLSHPDKEN